MKISLEYCHIVPGADDTNKVIFDNNFWMPKLMKMFEGDNVQKCIMIDDVHANIPVTEEFIQDLVKRLKIKPDCIYLESSFVHHAKKLIEKIDSKQRTIIQSGEKTFIRENITKYSSIIEFLISWKQKNGEVKFSCPTLAATSYLYRLGFIEGNVQSVYGELIDTADYCFNVLWAKYLSVEDDSKSLIASTYKQALEKISWHFY